MVLRIKEREEAIQLLAMDPYVCGKLLTLHRKGNRVDVEALRDQIPLRKGAGKGPKVGSHGNRGLRWRKSIFVDASVGLGIFVNLQAKEQGQGVLEGARGPAPLGARPRGLSPPRGSSHLDSKSYGCISVQEKSPREFYSVWTPFDIPFLRNSKTMKKQELALGSRLIGQSQKSYKIAYKCI